MGWNAYQKERNGKYYWYEQRSVRVPGRATPKTEIRYLGPSFLQKGQPWEKSDIPKSLRAARAHYARAHPPSPERLQKQQQVREFNRHMANVAEAQKVEFALRERENARQPAAERARDRYMALREQQQAQIRSYGEKVDEDFQKHVKAAEEWAKEHNLPAPFHSSPTNSPQPASSSERAHPSAPEPSSEPSSSEPQR
jgi:hypothetical protein